MTTTLEAAHEGEPTAYPPVETQPAPHEDAVIARAAPLPVGRARTIALLSLFLASTMELLDTTIVNVALPTIETGLQRECGAAAVDGRGLPAGLRRRPHHRVRASVTCSAASGSSSTGWWGSPLMSAACGFAPNAEALVGFRALQGLGRRGDDPAGAVQPPGDVRPARAGQGDGAVHRSRRPVGGARARSSGRAAHRGRPRSASGGARSSSSTSRSVCSRSSPRCAGCRNPLRHSARGSTSAGVSRARGGPARDPLPADHGTRAGLAGSGCMPRWRRLSWCSGSSPGRRSGPSGLGVSRWWR